MQIKTLTLTCFFALALILTDASAQGLKSLRIGIDGGVQFTSVQDNRMFSESGIGFSAGAYVETPIGEVLNLSLGAYLDKRNFNLNKAWVLQDYEAPYYIGQASYYLESINYSTNYLTLPVSITYMKGENKFKIFIQMSVYYSLLINADQDGYSQLYISPIDTAHFTTPEWKTPGITEKNLIGSVTESFNSYDFGLNFYIGGLYDISPKMSIKLSPGITYSTANVWSNPTRTAHWTSIFKINAGIVYKLK